jgi:hypothetical protein
VFCSHDEPLAGTLVSGPAPSGLNDQAYIKMVHMAFGNMFPTNNPEGINEPRAPHVLTGTGFRLLCETTDRCGPGRCCAPDLG